MWIASALAVIAVTFAWAGSLHLPSVRADVDDAAAGGDARSFCFRAAPWTSALRLPLTSEGALLVAGAVSTIPDRTLRRCAAVVAVAVAARLQVRDFGHHASSLNL